MKKDIFVEEKAPELEKKIEEEGWRKIWSGILSQETIFRNPKTVLFNTVRKKAKKHKNYYILYDNLRRYDNYCGAHFTFYKR